MTSVALPLADLIVRVDVSDPNAFDAVQAAVGILLRLGATVSDATAGDETVDETGDVTVCDLRAVNDLPRTHEPVVTIDGTDLLTDVDGLPEGTLTHAGGLTIAAAVVVAVWSRADIGVDGRTVALHVLLPVGMAAAYGAPHREPRPPVAVGSGWVANDISGEDDRVAFERVLTSLGARNTDPVAVADEAQTWRLPVCAFVEPSNGQATTRPRRTATRSAHSQRHLVDPDLAPLAGVVVCDLTAMWAGPLTTWLFASLGADVHKIEPTVRRDGLRSLDGTGIHPPGTDPSRGDSSGMFNALNRGKHIHDLDLRQQADRERFEALVARSHVVIDSFSRRVMPNLGYDAAQLRALRPDVVTVSISAFPADHRWQVALGPGVHAAAGLGLTGDGGAAMPTVAYPDPITGLTAFLEAMASLWSARDRGSAAHRSISMLAATSPIAAYTTTSNAKRVGRRDPGLGQRLLDDPRMADCWQTVDDGAGHHRYPRTPFRGAWHPPSLSAVAALDHGNAIASRATT